MSRHIVLSNGFPHAFCPPGPGDEVNGRLMKGHRSDHTRPASSSKSHASIHACGILVADETWECPTRLCVPPTLSTSPDPDPVSRLWWANQGHFLSIDLHAASYRDLFGPDLVSWWAFLEAAAKERGIFPLPYHIISALLPELA